MIQTTQHQDKVPVGWKTAHLMDVLHKTGSVNPQQYPNDDFEYIDVSSVSRESFSIENTTRMKGADAPNRARRQVKEGDVLFATIRPTLQRVAIVPDYLDGQVCSTGFFVLRPKTEIDRRFLYYYLFTKPFMYEMECRQKGASYPAVNDSDIREQIISFPPLSEQKRIVAILDEAFEGIEKAKTNAQKNLENARELFESYLQSVFNFIWNAENIVCLSDLTTDITDGDHQPPPKSPNGIPFITIRNIEKDTRKINFDETFKVSNEYYNALKPNKKPTSGDILYTVTGSYGIPVLVMKNIDFCFQRHIGLVRPKPGINSEWLYYLLMSPQVFNQANEGATGTAQKTVSLKLLRNFKVPLVPTDAQKTIAQKLNDISTETTRLESIYQQKLDNLEELKKSILQKAFNGELH